MTAIDTDVAAVQRMFDINLFGPMRMVRSFHPMIIAAKGAIVNIGSIGGIIPYLYGCECISCSYMNLLGALHTYISNFQHRITRARRRSPIGETLCVWRCLLLSEYLVRQKLARWMADGNFDTSVKVITVCRSQGSVVASPAEYHYYRSYRAK